MRFLAYESSNFTAVLLCNFEAVYNAMWCGNLRKANLMNCLWKLFVEFFDML